ncbi:hypothetical protein HK096_009080, partial [Nowakowskiella sp. JEL0078]
MFLILEYVCLYFKYISILDVTYDIPMLFNHANQSSVNLSKKIPMRKELLVILDLNGTLLKRVKRENKALANLNPTLPPNPYLILNQNRLVHFILNFKAVIFSPLDFASWTSAKLMNAIPINKRTFGDDYQNLIFSWDRSKCKLVDHRDTRGKFSTVKDLDFVWNDINSNKHRKWNETNTVIVDDTSSKLANQPNNHILIPNFDVCNNSVDCLNDTTLLSLSKYFDLLFDSDYQDVREFIRSNPFCSTSNLKSRRLEISPEFSVSDLSLLSHKMKLRPPTGLIVISTHQGIEKIIVDTEGKSTLNSANETNIQSTLVNEMVDRKQAGNVDSDIEYEAKNDGKQDELDLISLPKLENTEA